MMANHKVPKMKQMTELPGIKLFNREITYSPR